MSIPICLLQNSAQFVTAVVRMYQVQGACIAISHLSDAQSAGYHVLEAQLFVRSAAMVDILNIFSPGLVNMISVLLDVDADVSTSLTHFQLKQQNSIFKT